MKFASKLIHGGPLPPYVHLCYGHLGAYIEPLAKRPQGHWFCFYGTKTFICWSTETKNKIPKTLKLCQN